MKEPMVLVTILAFGKASASEAIRSVGVSDDTVVTCDFLPAEAAEDQGKLKSAGQAAGMALHRAVKGRARDTDGENA